MLLFNACGKDILPLSKALKLKQKTSTLKSFLLHLYPYWSLLLRVALLCRIKNSPIVDV